MDAHLRSVLQQDDETCHDHQILIGHMCGCRSSPPPVTDCYVCPNGQPIPDPTKEVRWFDRVGLEGLDDSVAPTCGLVEAMSLFEYQVGKTAQDFVCLAIQLKSGQCGCSIDWRPIFLTWAYRVSGGLSILVRFDPFLVQQLSS